MTFVENVYKHWNKHMNDQQTLKAMRAAVLVFSVLVLAYAMLARGKPIYDLVSGAYPGDAGRRLHPAGVRVVLEARDYAGRGRRDRTGVVVWLAVMLGFQAGLRPSAATGGVLHIAYRDVGWVAGTAVDRKSPRPCASFRRLTRRPCIGRFRSARASDQNSELLEYPLGDVL